MMEERPSSGYWPANSINDIIGARNSLREKGHQDADFLLVSHHRVNQVFEHQIHNTRNSYRDWLLKQEILYSIIIDNDREPDAAYLYATTKGIPITRTVGGLHVIPMDSIVKITEIMSAW